MKRGLTRRDLIGTGTGTLIAASVPATALGRIAEGPREFADLPKLDELQSGHLRHFRNILALPDGHWGSMASDDPLHAGDFTGYQYQLSGMALAMGNAHMHRLPNAPGFFRADMDRLVHKMLRPEVWQYWYSMSGGHPMNDPSLTAPNKLQWDPVANENIMYSGHLSIAAGLYSYLFSDAKYDSEGAFVFRNYQDGFSKRRVEYSLKSLNDLIYWQYVSNGYVGVACQPNAVFLGCNQFPLWGIKWQDSRLGGDRGDNLIESHVAAWKRFGGFQNGREMPFLWFAKQKVLAREGGKSMFDETAPIMTAMNWSQWILNGTMPEYTKSIWPYVSAASLARDDRGALVLMDPSMTGRPGQRYARGLDVLAGRPAAPLEKKSGRDDAYAGFWGWFAQNMSEHQDPRLGEFLAYVDANMNPTWSEGGLYYPVRSETWVDGRFVGVTPTSGNAHFAYARLNVRDGLNKLVMSNWDDRHFAEPSLTGVSREVDIVRGIFLPEKQVLVVTARPYRGGKPQLASFEFENVRLQGRGWTLEIDGQVAVRGNATQIASSELPGTEFSNGKLSVRTPIERETTIALRFS